METGSPHIVLMGLRGSGKSTIGALLARELGREFVDLDDRTPGYAGATTVAEVFERQGEDAFRAAERTALADVLSEPASVIALGGGTPTAPGVADLLRDGSVWLVYLRAQPSMLRSRLVGDDNTDRPPLLGQDVLTEIEQVFAARDSLYVRLADHVIDTTGRSSLEVLKALRRTIN